MPLVRLRVLYSGRVQGVGFRATARWIARGFRVAGFVRNLPDGRVELVAEGDRNEVDAFLEAVQNELGGFIHDRSTESQPPGSPPLEGFTIRF